METQSQPLCGVQSSPTGGLRWWALALILGVLWFSAVDRPRGRRDHVARRRILYNAASGLPSRVLFFLDRGLLSGFSGYVYVSDDALLARPLVGQTVRRAERLDDHWYWVAAR